MADAASILPPSARLEVRSPWRVLSQDGPASPVPSEEPDKDEAELSTQSSLPDIVLPDADEPLPTWKRWAMIGVLGAAGAAVLIPTVTSIMHPQPVSTSLAKTLPPAPRQSLTPTVQTPEASQWVTVVGIGDSMTAGMQDGTLGQDHQPHSYLAQMTTQAGITFNTPYIEAKGIPPRVLGPVFDANRYTEVRGSLESAVKMLAIKTVYTGAPKDVSSIWRFDGVGVRTPESRDSKDRPQHNFAVPGFEFRHLTDIRSVRDFTHEINLGTDEVDALANEVPLTREILQNGTERSRGSQVEQAVKTKPDIVVLWAGANDALAPAFSGVVDDRTLTPLLDQTWEFWHQDLATKQWIKRQTRETMPGMISSIMGPNGPVEQIKKNTNAHIFIFNVPEVDVVPYLKTVGKPVGALPFRVQIQNGDDVTDLVQNFVIPTRIEGEGIRGRRHFPEGSRVGLGAVLEMIVEEGKGADRALFAQRLEELQHKGFLSEFDVLDNRELETVKDRVQEYNELLRIAARDPRVHLIDVNQKLSEAREKGLVLKSADGRDVRVSTTFTGVPDARGYDGMFSLDGIHPSDTGHAILANLLLEKIQDDLGADPRYSKFLDVPPIDEAAVNARDTHGPRVAQERAPHAN